MSICETLPQRLQMLRVFRNNKDLTAYCANMLYCVCWCMCMYLYIYVSICICICRTLCDSVERYLNLEDI